MKIAVVAPVRPGQHSGNDVTASRWCRRFVELGHEAEVLPWREDVQRSASDSEDPAPESDLLVVLHARRCAAAVTASRSARPDRPVVVGLAGTDLYVDLPEDAITRRSLDLADQLVVLQRAAVDRLTSIEPAWAAKARVVHQSVDPPLPERRAGDEHFTVAVLAHLRDVKDPLMAARAARALPATSRIRVVHLGAAHDEVWRARATEETAANPCYEWLGERGRREALELLARSQVLACTSRREGGANVVSEAIALGVGVVGTRIDGNTGLLGDDHPGLVEVGDDDAFASLLSRLAADSSALAELERRSLDQRWMTDPANERSEWHRVLENL